MGGESIIAVAGELVDEALVVGAALAIRTSPPVGTATDTRDEDAVGVDPDLTSSPGAAKVDLCWLRDRLVRFSVHGVRAATPPCERSRPVEPALNGVPSPLNA